MNTRTLAPAVVVALLASSCTAWTWGNRYDLGPSTPSEEPPGWIHTSASAFHTCRLDFARALWCHGENRFGEVGDGTGEATDDFVRIGNDTWLDVVTIAAATCGVKVDHTLWCWGVINDGTYPPDPADLVLAPERVGSAADWRAVGGSFTALCGIKDDGSLWCWGANRNFQVGDGTTEYRPEPVQISADAWISVDSGYSVSCGVQTDHTLWCWGADLVGESGQNRSEIHDLEFPTPTRVGEDADWQEVSIGDSFACAVKTDGTLWCWGSFLYTTNQSFADVPTQVGDAATWRTVDTGQDTACAIRRDNSMWCWGSNERGWVGDGTTDDRSEPVQVGLGQNWIDVSVFWTADALALSTS